MITSSNFFVTGGLIETNSCRHCFFRDWKVISCKIDNLIFSDLGILTWDFKAGVFQIWWSWYQEFLHLYWGAVFEGYDISKKFPNFSVFNLMNWNRLFSETQPTTVSNPTSSCNFLASDSTFCNNIFASPFLLASTAILKDFTIIKSFSNFTFPITFVFFHALSVFQLCLVVNELIDQTQEQYLKKKIKE